MGQLPLLFSRLPYASANLVAFLGIVLACWRRDALSLGFAFCAAATVAAERVCLEDHPRVLAQAAARIVWQHDVVAIYAPVKPQVVARLLDEHPVRWVQLSDKRRIPPGRLTPSPECGPGWYSPESAVRN